MNELKELKVKAYDKLVEIEKSITETKRLEQELQQINQHIQKLQNEQKAD